MNKKPLFSVCIPTYNRSEELKRCIESLIHQDEFSSENVEIIISDNCSTDNTKDLGEQYARKYENIHYFRNEKNVTMENFPIVLSEATGCLAKLTNDTTVFNPGSLKKILDLIKINLTDKPAFFFLNSGKKDCYCDTLEDFLYNVSFYTTWIGGFALWDDDRIGIRNRTKDCETMLWQVPIILESVVKHKKTYIIKEKLFTNPIDVKKRLMVYNSNLFTIFYENYLVLLEPFFIDNKIDDSCCEWLKKDLLYNFFTNWLIIYKRNRKKIDDEKDLIDLVFAAYQDKKYFKNYKVYFNYQYIKRSIKDFFKIIFDVFYKAASK